MRTTTFLAGILGAVLTLPALAQGSSTAAPGMQGGALTDGQILGVLKTVNDAEIDAAKSILPKTRNSQVRRFAEHMIRDHTQSNVDVQAAAIETGDKVADSPISDQLKQTTQSQAEGPSTQSGSGLDEQYIDDQVKDHQDVLRMIQGDLIPSAHSDRVKDLLDKAQSMVSEHLRDAQQVQASLNR